jgi:hypothetical protein
MALFQLLYMSSLVGDGPQVLPAILEASIRNNKQRGITGMMLYADGNVTQVLEGEKDTVLKTFRAIQSDARHRGLFVLIEQDIGSRQFASWSMGFKQLSAADLEALPEAAPLFKARPEEVSLRVRPGDALAVLTSFAEGPARGP